MKAYRITWARLFTAWVVHLRRNGWDNAWAALTAADVASEIMANIEKRANELRTKEAA